MTKKQETSASFRSWFGESKIVDEDGRPLVCYHGTAARDFTAFIDWRPAFFTTDRKYADEYTGKSVHGKGRGRVIQAYLSIQRPFDTRDEAHRKIYNEVFVPTYQSKFPRDADRYVALKPGELQSFIAADQFFSFLKTAVREGRLNFDGFFVSEGAFTEAVSIVPLHAWQIKSATRNDGTFDSDDANIFSNPGAGDETKGSEDVKAFLAGPGQVPMIGPESGSVKANGIARFESPHGSVRFVYFEDRKPVSVLQIVRVGRTAHVANAYTLASRRRRGLASKLMLEAARYADENGLRILPSEHQSPMGRAWWQAQGMKKNPAISKLQMPKHLYHGTLKERVGSVLSPRRGAQVAAAYGSEGRGYVFATEDPLLALAHARNQLTIELGREPTASEMRRSAVVLVIVPRLEDWAHVPDEDEGDDGREHPPEAEPGDWYTPYEVKVDHALSGEDLPGRSGGRVVKNPLLSKPPKALHRLQNTRAFRELVGRPPTDADYEGVHTTGSELIAGSYAMSAWEQHDREGYPVIVTLDVSGLQPEPDVDAMLRGGEAIKLLRSQYKQAVDDGQTFYELLEEEGYGDEGEARPGDSPSAFIFEDVGLHVLGAIESTEDPEAIFEDFIERGLLPPEVLSKIVDQQRYLNDFDIDRVVRVEALKPWWGRVLVSFDDDDAQELADRGWEVFTLDEWPFKSPGATQTVWEAPDAAKRKEIEFHGTTSLVIDLAFPGLIPPESPFQIQGLDMEENGSPPDEWRGAECAHCGTWIRVKPVFKGGRVYGQRCAALLKTASVLEKRERVHPEGPGAVHAQDFRMKFPHIWAHLPVWRQK